MVTYNNSTDTYGTTSFIVDSTTIGKGNYATIQTAITAASSGQTIFIRPGTYTENLTLKAGVNLVAWECDAYSGNVIISGKCTFTGIGGVCISGIQLQTNSDFCLSISGSSASIVNLVNCNINCTNNTGIQYSSSSASSGFSMQECVGNLTAGSIAVFAFSGAGTVNIINSYFNNTGASTTANTISAGSVGILTSTFLNPITTSGTSVFSLGSGCNLTTAAINVTALTIGGSGSQAAANCYIASGTASCISISSTLGLGLISLSSTNTNVITGAGTANWSGIYFANTSHQYNVTTQSGGAIPGMQNTSATNTPAAGMLGELQTASGTSVSLSNNTPTNVCSINLTPGVWDVSALGSVSNTGNFTDYQMGISATTGSLAGLVVGQTMWRDSRAGSAQTFSGSVMVQRVTLTANATYYLVSQATFSTGVSNANGKLSGTRVG